MTSVFAILAVQAVLGAFDNFWHHELEAKLPQRISARYELALHAAREAIYGVLFLGLAWARWEGAWAWVLMTLLAAEVVITLADFIEEDLTRRLPPLERVLHTILAASYGAFVAALAPTLGEWMRAPSALPLAGHSWISWLFTAAAAAVLAWSVRNTIAVIGLRHRARDLPRKPPPARGLAVLVTGGTGFIGGALLRSFAADGRRVIVLTRDARRAAACLGAGVRVIETLDALPDETPIEAVVNLAGAPILGGRWTPHRRARLIASRLDTTRQLIGFMQRLERPPAVLVSASAVGFYGLPKHGDRLDETAPSQPGNFPSDLCAAWEDAAETARSLGVRVVRLRFGVVLGRSGGIYPALERATRLGLGAVLGRGGQKMPWIHIEDAVGLMQFVIEMPELDGAVNAVAPDQVTQAEFARTLARCHDKSLRLKIPAAPLKAILGDAAQLLLEGQAAIPAAASTAGYIFRHGTMAAALSDLSAAARKRSLANTPRPAASSLMPPGRRVSRR